MGYSIVKFYEKCCTEYGLMRLCEYRCCGGIPMDATYMVPRYNSMRSFAGYDHNRAGYTSKLSKLSPPIAQPNATNRYLPQPQ